MQTLTLLEPFGALVRPIELNAGLETLPVDVILDAVKQHRVVVFRDFALLEGARLPEYCASLGKIMEWDFGPVNELRVSADARNYLYTNRDVPFHWDGPFAGCIPSFIFFQCDKAPRPKAGGETLFTDTVRLLEAAGPEERERWRGIEITYTTEKIVHYGGSFTSPMIVSNADDCDVVRYAEPVEDINPVYLEIAGIGQQEHLPFIRQMHGLLRDRRFCYQHEWKDGDIVIADNTTLLHGRNAFAENAERLIRRVNIL